MSRAPVSRRPCFASAIWSEVWRPLGFRAAPGEDFVRERLAHHVEHWREHGFGLWALEERGSDLVAGWAGPSHPDQVPELADEIEIGWTLRREFQGRGLATGAARIAVATAFAQLPPRRVISLIHPMNGPSIAVALRLGMRREREVLHPRLGERLDVYALRRGGGAATGA